MPATARVTPRMTEREEDFVREYLIDFNGAAAAIRAGYTKQGAARSAAKLLADPAIAAAIEARRETTAKERRATADRVIEELARIAFADMRRFVDWNKTGVHLRDKARLSGVDAAAIADVDMKGRGNGKVGKVKLYDKLAALNALAKHLGMVGPKAPLGPTDFSVGGRDARKVLVERLRRIAKGEDGS
jgi:phage terminase small subunit